MIRTVHSREEKEIQERLEHLGFRVVVDPPADQLPADLGGYVPDLLALRGTERLLIEIKSPSARGAVERYKALAEQVSQWPGWRLLIVTREDSLEQLLTHGGGVDWIVLRKKLIDARRMFDEGLLQPVVLFAWSILETALRARAAQQQLPIATFPVRNVLNHLYSLGEIGLDDHEFLQASLEARTALAHGIDVELGHEQVAGLLAVVERCVEEWSVGGAEPLS